MSPPPLLFQPEPGFSRSEKTERVASSLEFSQKTFQGKPSATTGNSHFEVTHPAAAGADPNRGYGVNGVLPSIKRVLVARTRPSVGTTPSNETVNPLTDTSQSAPLPPSIHPSLPPTTPRRFTDPPHGRYSNVGRVRRRRGQSCLRFAESTAQGVGVGGTAHVAARR